MRIEIIRGDDSRRERWIFEPFVDITQDGIYFNSYGIETRKTKRQVWKRQFHWSRLMRRDNTITVPPLPKDVEDEMRKGLRDYIDTWKILR